MTVEAAVPAAKKRARDTLATTGGHAVTIADLLFLFVIVILFLFAFQDRSRFRQPPNPIAG
jgi:hypothetical protein